MNEDKPTTRAEARDRDPIRDFLYYDSQPAFAELEVVGDARILPLWARRVFYVAGTLAGAGALIVGGYDAELAKNIAGAGVILVASLALANPSR